MIFSGMLFLFVAIQLLVVAYLDFKYRIISNQWVFINLFFYFVMCFLFPRIYILAPSSMMYSLAFIIVGIALFALKIMGGGDSKYLASLFLLIPLKFQEEFFTYLLYTTVIVGSSLLLFNLLKNLDRIIYLGKMSDMKGIKKIFGKKFTYAPVIFISWMWFGWKNFSAIKWTF